MAKARWMNQKKPSAAMPRELAVRNRVFQREVIR